MAASFSRGSSKYSAALASESAIPASPPETPSQVSGGMLKSLLSKTSCAIGSNTRCAALAYSVFPSVCAAWARAIAGPTDPVYRSIPRTVVCHAPICCCQSPGLGASHVRESCSLPPRRRVPVSWSAIAAQSSRSCCSSSPAESNSAGLLARVFAG